MTCFDQISGNVVAYVNDQERAYAEDAFLAEIGEKVGAKTIFTSHGPTRDTVTVACTKIKEPLR